MKKQHHLVIFFVLNVFIFPGSVFAESYSLSPKSNEKVLYFQSTIMGETVERKFNKDTTEYTNYYQMLVKKRGKVQGCIKLWGGRKIDTLNMKIDEKLNINMEAIADGRRSKATLTTIIYHDLGIAETTVKALDLDSYKEGVSEWKANVNQVQRYIELLGTKFALVPTTSSAVGKSELFTEQFRAKGGQTIVLTKKAVKDGDSLSSNKKPQDSSASHKKLSVQLNPINMPSHVVLEVQMAIANLNASTPVMQGSIIRQEDGAVSTTGTAMRFDDKGQPLKQ